MSAQISTSVVVPCFNESGNAVALIQEIEGVLAKSALVDFVLVDNGSTDNTYELLIALTSALERVQVVRLARNEGYGGGIKFGLGFCQGEVIGWTHADLQTKPSDVLLAHTLYRGGPPFLIKGVRHGRPFGDRLFSAGMGLFTSLLFGMRLREINAQPTLFSRSLLVNVLAGPSDFGLDLHTIVIARKLGLEEKRMPVSFGARFSGKSSWNTSWRSRLKFIGRTVAYSVRLRQELWRYANH